MAGNDERGPRARTALNVDTTNDETIVPPPTPENACHRCGSLGLDDMAACGRLGLYCWQECAAVRLRELRGAVA